MSLHAKYSSYSLGCHHFMYYYSLFCFFLILLLNGTVKNIHVYAIHRDEGVMTMSLGEKAMLHITSDYGYGAQGAGGVIPPNAGKSRE
jgi:FKBP-type peptidyl-prolyl cis-trans isomerase